MTTPHMLALDAAIAEIEVPDPDPAGWIGQLTGVARQLRAAVRTHHDIFPPSLGVLPGGGRTLRCHERVLGIMRAGGLSDSQSVAGLYLLWLIVCGIDIEDAQSGKPGGATPGMPPEISQHMPSLPRDRFPNLAAVGRELFETSHDERFDVVLGIFIDGLSGGGNSAQAISRSGSLCDSACWAPC